MLGQYSGSRTNYRSLFVLNRFSFKEAIADYIETISGSRIRTIAYHFDGTGLLALLQSHFKVPVKGTACTINYKGVPYVVEVVQEFSDSEIFTITESY